MTPSETPTPAQQLEPCPFCGGKPIIQLKGNVKSHRKLTVKCPDCRIQRTDATLRHGEEWLFNIAIAAWNTRTPNTRALAALEAVEWRPMDSCPVGQRVMLWNHETKETSIGHKPEGAPSEDAVVVGRTAAWADAWLPLPTPPADAVEVKS